VGGVKFKHEGEVLDGDFDFFKFLVGASDDEIGAGISLVEVEHAVTVLNGLLEHLLLHEGGGPNEEGLAVSGVGSDFGRADADEIVDIDLVAVGLGGCFSGVAVLQVLERAVEAGERRGRFFAGQFQHIFELYR
jgi:hypothetical protein